VETKANLGSFWSGVADLIDEVRAAAEATPKHPIEISGDLSTEGGVIPVSVFLGLKDNQFFIIARTITVVPEHIHSEFDATTDRFTGDVALIGQRRREHIPQGAQPGQIIASAGYVYDLKTDWPCLASGIVDVCTDLRRAINAADALMAGKDVSEARDCFDDDEESCYERITTIFVPFPQTSQSSGRT